MKRPALQALDLWSVLKGAAVCAQSVRVQYLLT